MIKATKQDRSVLITLFLEFFENNENIHFLVKNDEKKPQRLVHLAEYLFEWGMALDAIYFLQEKKGFVIIYLSDKRLKIIKEIALTSKLVFQVITLYRLLKILKRRLRISNILKRETKKNKYLHFYALGVNKRSRGYAADGFSPIVEAKYFINELIDKHQVPMYLETVNPRNKKLYEFAGFVTYQEDVNKKEGLSTWFLKKEK